MTLPGGEEHATNLPTEPYDTKERMHRQGTFTEQTDDS